MKTREGELQSSPSPDIADKFAREMSSINAVIVANRRPAKETII
jgi:hypothetical protein